MRLPNWLYVPLCVAVALVVIGSIVFAFAAAIATAVGIPICNASTKNIGLSHRWSLFGGCQVDVGDGRWVPLDNYRWMEE